MNYHKFYFALFAYSLLQAGYIYFVIRVFGYGLKLGDQLCQLNGICVTWIHDSVERFRGRDEEGIAIKRAMLENALFTLMIYT
jgi:hypothetical protein